MNEFVDSEKITQAEDQDHDKGLYDELHVAPG
ncbi:hypothetical protein F442_16058 [Phytophthora nicotianae P10297]|uniref:Uncharacterized protein n=3 Tax=Phytophthora nicotianae TaxID=4792 RepID=V9EIR4_PHYNI|nr:hypothetical protein F443_16206 [Phytophthora nicotianae P1569]ETO66724.1 hypothetical protein F444_16191 [Phytophthora nicotianae P1976]ETP35869.1 hypothetical protein F442_16058 [Phytophthora nicotianae P10297]